MPWVVAKFHSQRDDGPTLTAIPSSWITKVGGKNYALYPPVDISGSELKRLVYKGDDPGDDWDLLHLKYVSPCFDSIIEALDFECKAADLNKADLEAFEKTGTIGKRKRKAGDIRYPNEPASSEVEGVEEIMDPLSTTALEGERSTETVEINDDVIEIGHKQVDGTEPGSPMKLFFNSGKAVKLMANRSPKPREIIRVDEVNEQQAMSNTSQSVMPVTKNCGGVAIKTLMRKLDQKVTCQMESIMNEIRSMKGSLEMLSSQVNHTPAMSDPDDNFVGCEHIVTLPVDSFEDLIALQNEIIASPKFRKYMFKTLKDHAPGLVYRGTTELNRTVNSCLATLMTNQFARMLCMKNRSMNKVSFESNFSTLITLIHEVVSEKKVEGPDIDLGTLKRSMGEWLRQSRNRNLREKVVTTYYEVGGRIVHVDENSAR